MRSGDFPQIVAPTMYANGGDVPSWLQPTRRDTSPADYAYSPPPPQRDDPLNSELNRGAMTAKEYAAKRPKPRDPQLKAKGGKIHPAIHHHIAHALIKLAEGGTVDEHAHDANPEPSEAQRRAGNFKHGHAVASGMKIVIETPAGAKRRPEWPPLTAHYGRLAQTVGADDEPVDVFVKPRTPLDHEGPVHVVDQIKPDGSFDEAKVMHGYASPEEAGAAYKSNYPKDFKGMGAITEMKLDRFKNWLEDGDKDRPIARKAFTKTEDGRYLCSGGAA